MDKIELAKFNAAMEKACGNRAVAAALLRVTTDQLHDRLKDNPELAKRWVNSKKPEHQPKPITDAQGVQRGDDPILPGEMTREEQDLFRSMIKQDAVLKEGLSKLNLTEKEAALAVELFKFNKQDFTVGHHIISSSNVRLVLFMHTQADEIAIRLNKVRELMSKAPWDSGPSEEREMLAREESFLMDSLIRITEVVNRLQVTSQRGLLMMAMAQYRRNGGKGNYSGKPGFRTVPQAALEEPG